MNRMMFLARLRDGLKGLPQSAINDIIADYETHFAEGMAAGRSEDDVAEALGDPSRLARELRAEAGIQRWEAEPNAGNFLGVIVALLGLATIDVIFIFPFLVTLAGIFLVWAIVCICMFVGGIVFSFSVLPVGFLEDFGSGIVRGLAALGLISGSVGLMALLLLVISLLARLLIKFARLHYQLLDSANKSI